MFGRAEIFYSDGGTNGPGLPLAVHSWIFNASGNSPASGGGVAMNVANDGKQYFLNYHPATTPEQSARGGTPTT